MKLQNNIILIGMPGSGKTTTGKLLAQKLGFDFLDMDDVIEKSEGMKISEIFKLEGEEYFRNLETSLLESLLEKENLILSTGGGVILFNNNYELLKKIGKIVYLKILPDKIYERIKEDKTRPLLLDVDLKKKLNELFKKREEYYKRADFEIGADCEPEKIADRIISNL